MLSGRWTYRSYRSTPALVGGDARAALALIFGEGVFDFEAGEGGRFGGALGMGTGYALTLQGETLPGDPPGFSIVGLGIDGTPTEGWRYDYRGVTAHRWPDGVDQVPCLLGTVVRVNAHGPSSPAGYTASFIAVRQSGDPTPRNLRQSSLTREI
ncbi:MAG TPA: hypothetical protein VF715_04990 [Thermoleophilaceae bacterium]|jgi:hypothetical protein